MNHGTRHWIDGQPGLFGLLLAVGDFLVVAVSGVLAALLIAELRPQLEVLWPLPDSYRVPILLGTLLAPSLLNWFGIYRQARGVSHRSELRQVLIAMLSVALLLAVCALATKTGARYSRLWMGCWFLLALGGLCSLRLLLWSVLSTLRSRGFDVERVALVGGGALAQRVAEHLMANPGSGLELSGYFAANAEEGQGSARLPCLGSLDDIKETLAAGNGAIDQLWIVLPLTADESIRRLLHELRHSTVDIRLVPDMFSYQLLNYSTENILGLPVLNLSYSPLSGPNRYAKDLLDRVLALGILLLIAPLLLLISAAIKLSSPGPVLFRQDRHGNDGETFTVYKFRSMHVRPPETGYQQARRDDPRVTRLGSFLRRTSLDELPQFINVLQGSMSIVGPRPHPCEMNDIYCDQVERYMWRHKVKPGITGWAQVNGYRGETDTLDKMRKRVEYDLYYIEHWSLLFDIRIILMTVWKGFSSRNAY
ncbi:MAG TPA: undecaprenyl-phosphate glucose phosphotransferase [Solimonas sp.]|nr:undecaprenyl-phosphate glucose phosphotransferase [Solimonas sp.]